jgi:hypothetical protein
VAVAVHIFEREARYNKGSITTHEEGCRQHNGFLGIVAGQLDDHDLAIEVERRNSRGQAIGVAVPHEALHNGTAREAVARVVEAALPPRHNGLQGNKEGEQGQGIGEQSQQRASGEANTGTSKRTRWCVNDTRTNSHCNVSLCKRTIIAFPPPRPHGRGTLCTLLVAILAQRTYVSGTSRDAALKALRRQALRVSTAIVRMTRFAHLNRYPLAQFLPARRYRLKASPNKESRQWHT